jgi:hypothetical protein
MTRSEIVQILQHARQSLDHIANAKTDREVTLCHQDVIARSLLVIADILLERGPEVLVGHQEMTRLMRIREEDGD